MPRKKTTAAEQEPATESRASKKAVPEGLVIEPMDDLPKPRGKAPAKASAKKPAAKKATAKKPAAKKRAAKTEMSAPVNAEAKANAVDTFEDAFEANDTHEAGNTADADSAATMAQAGDESAEEPQDEHPSLREIKSVCRRSWPPQAWPAGAMPKR